MADIEYHSVTGAISHLGELSRCTESTRKVKRSLQVRHLGVFIHVFDVLKNGATSAT